MKRVAGLLPSCQSSIENIVAELQAIGGRYRGYTIRLPPQRLSTGSRVGQFCTISIQSQQSASSAIVVHKYIELYVARNRFAEASVALRNFIYTATGTLFLTTAEPSQGVNTKQRSRFPKLTDKGTHT